MQMTKTKEAQITRNSTNARLILAHADCHVNPLAITFTNNESKCGYKQSKNNNCNHNNQQTSTTQDYADFSARVAVGAVEANAEALRFAIGDNAAGVGRKTALRILGRHTTLNCIASDLHVLFGVCWFVYW
jgi:hypothetical protein